jgi:putative transposase
MIRFSGRRRRRDPARSVVATMPHPLRGEPDAVTSKSSWGWVKALLHSVYDQPDADAVHAQFDRIVDALTDKLPTVAAHLDDARADIVAFTAYPKDLWRQVWSNNPNGGLIEANRMQRIVGQCCGCGGDRVGLVSLTAVSAVEHADSRGQLRWDVDDGVAVVE